MAEIMAHEKCHFLAFVIVEWSGKLSVNCRNNTSDVTVGELENCVDSKCEDLSGKSWCFVLL